MRGNVKVYGVAVDVERFQTLIPKDERIWSSGLLAFDGRAKGEWRSIDTYVHNPILTRGNFFHLCPGALVFDETAYGALDEALERAGEILPISVEGGENLFLLNVTECVNALDAGSSEWRLSRDGVRLGVKQYAFHASRLPESSLFKVPETVRGDVLAVWRGPEDEGFIEAYRSANLTGLAFTPIWQNEM